MITIYHVQKHACFPFSHGYGDATKYLHFFKQCANIWCPPRVKIEAANTVIFLALERIQGI